MNKNTSFTRTLTALATAAALFVPLAAQANTFLFDVSGIFSVDAEGDPLNETFSLNIGPKSRVVGLGWDVALSADSPSFLSHMVVSFGPSAGLAPVLLTPGVGNDFGATLAFSSGGIVDLVGVGLDFSVGADGTLKLEFFENVDDFADLWDGRWRSGTLTIQTQPIPEPGTYALMLLGLGALGAVARRRKG